MSKDPTQNKMKVIREDVWYSEGLGFECTGCGECCTGAPGYVFVTQEEIASIATHLNLPIQEFANRYLRKITSNWFSLKENKHTYDCVFLKDKKCSIYDFRPVQCRTFPFWPKILENKDSWDQAAKQCEGICHTAKRVSFEEIERMRKMHENKIVD